MAEFARSHQAIWRYNWHFWMHGRFQYSMSPKMPHEVKTTERCMEPTKSLHCVRYLEIMKPALNSIEFTRSENKQQQIADCSRTRKSTRKVRRCQVVSVMGKHLTLTIKVFL
mmetsp:Transcript_16164/g.25889  ORF Transcript_16164/g.25889 Transcript_16164/m.25889 type:complete len:112 (+) Transcript_16164:127-462(+)